MTDTEQPTAANSGRNPPRKPGERYMAPVDAETTAPAETSVAAQKAAPKAKAGAEKTEE